ncbi:MAG: YggS family pyridoxal phosphate-dependent enzyme [Brevefilum sp.]|nr:YggS family pyridoxal phosphate-dependent enzyme [Brevefilum sp.]
MAETSFNQKVASIKDNLRRVETRIAHAAERAGRARQDVQLVAVTKLVPLEVIQAGIEAGLRSFGENYPEQAAEKIAALQTDIDLTWHMIGHIQSRKTNTVCEYFDWVHSVDRIKIAKYLDRYALENERVMPILIEVNLSGEDSKFGWKAWDENNWLDLVPQFEKIAQMPNLEIRGLMCMPPLFDDPELTRPYYQRLGRLQGFLKEELPEISWRELSIGTSFDYEVAVEEGATMVRLGTSLFGPRPAR